MQLVDTHCHIHEAWRSVNGDDASAKLWKKAGNPDADEIIARAVEAGVTKMICVGTTLADSKLAVEFVQTRPNCFASIGIHPHEAKKHLQADLQEFAAILTQVQDDDARYAQDGFRMSLLAETAHARESDRRASGLAHQIPAPLRPSLHQQAHAERRLNADLATSQGWQAAGQHPPRAQERARGRDGRADSTPEMSKQPIAIGECGLDYFYEYSPKKDQARILRFQIELALKHDLPLIFHVRDAFADFWPIFDEYKGIRGVIHSFSASQQEVEQILARGLYVGLNGIMTFTKHVKQLQAAQSIPLTSLLLETDAPFLTPEPFRGRICEPRHVRATAGFLAELRGESLNDLARTTSANAHQLFGI